RILNPGTDRERLLPAKDDTVTFAAGDVLRVLTPGGGGWGDPLERDPELVRLDVLRGSVSGARARDDYGVVLGAGGAVDAAATAAARASIRERRPPLRLFERGAGFDDLVAAGELELTTEDGLVATAG